MIRVLLVDDQDLVRAGFRIILDSEPGIEVVGEAADGAEAVELAAQLRPDVICMDVEMPVMDGIEASRRILGAERSSKPEGVKAEAEKAGAESGPGAPAAAQTSVLILTTFGHERYLFDALAAGVSGFLLKTSRAEQLIDAVRTLAEGDALLGSDVTRAVIERIAADRGRAGSGAGGSGSPGTGSGAAGSGDAGSGIGNPGSGTLSSEPGASSTAGAEPSREASETAEDPAAPGIAAMDEVGLTEREREVLALLAEGRSNAEIAATMFLGESTVKTHVSNLLQKLGARDRIQAVVWAHTSGVTRTG